MCNLYSIATNQEAIRALFRVIHPLRRQSAADARRVPGLPCHCRAQRRRRARADPELLIGIESQRLLQEARKCRVAYVWAAQF